MRAWALRLAAIALLALAAWRVAADVWFWSSLLQPGWTLYPPGSFEGLAGDLAVTAVSVLAAIVLAVLSLRRRRTG